VFDLDVVVLEMSPFDPSLGMMSLDQYISSELQLTNHLTNDSHHVNSLTIPLPHVHFGVWVIEVIQQLVGQGYAQPIPSLHAGSYPGNSTSNHSEVSKL